MRVHQWAHSILAQHFGGVSVGAAVWWAARATVVMCVLVFFMLRIPLDANVDQHHHQHQHNGWHPRSLTVSHDRLQSVRGSMTQSSNLMCVYSVHGVEHEPPPLPSLHGHLPTSTTPASALTQYQHHQHHQHYLIDVARCRSRFACVKPTPIQTHSDLPWRGRASRARWGAVDSIRYKWPHMRA
jgi:hypothetical protein